MKEKLKSASKHIFVDGLTGMSWGLFCTLIIGLIIEQIGMLIGSGIGNIIVVIGKICASLTGAGIGVGVAMKYKATPLVVISSAVAGLIGAFASKIIAGTVYANSVVTLVGPGEPLGAFVASLIGIEVGRSISGKTKIDIILVPIATIMIGGAIGLLVGPTISSFMTALGGLINWSVEKQPIIMGILVSVLMGMILTLPISSAAISIILNLSGIAAGAATVGCCANMIGFAVASFRENKWGGLIAQGIGTSMIQIGNIVKKPIIWLPAIITSAILGPLSTTIIKISSNASGGGMGTAGLVGPIMAWQTMIETETAAVVGIKIALMCFVLPGLIAWSVSEIMRKKELIKDGDMKLEL